MFSFSFKESQERETRKVDVFDFGKWVDASCKGNKIYHRGLLRVGSENIPHLWQKIALKIASAWSVWSPCLTVSITKALMFLFLLEKDFICFEINPRFPKCTVCFQAQHMRPMHWGHFVEGLEECTWFRSWSSIAKETACDSPMAAEEPQCSTDLVCPTSARNFNMGMLECCSTWPWLPPCSGRWI